MKKLLAKLIIGSGLLLSTSGVAWAAVMPIIHLDNCGTYGTVEYLENSQGPKVSRSYSSLAGDFLGYKVWKSGNLIKDTLGQPCDGDL